MRRRKLKTQFTIDVRPFLSIWLACLLLLGPFYFVHLTMKVACGSIGTHITSSLDSTPYIIESVRPKNPIYFDCQPDGLAIHPGNRWIKWEFDENGLSNIVKQLVNIESHSSKEYLVLLVRPHGIHTFRFMRELLHNRHFNFNIAEDVIDAGAIADWSKVIELNPKSTEAYFLRGYAEIPPPEILGDNNKQKKLKNQTFPPTPSPPR